ncbi:HK97 gp10 family phage protein [Spartinivicinus ruber]|uniref:HK97 gp10 family phage protein n=1 Tax=Spartinivicinus ruber TaxID=2683272 RepID=UPI0013D29539|nr:HK97 gp10 family phage protein [Spartinivicinus ruber]
MKLNLNLTDVEELTEQFRDIEEKLINRAVRQGLLEIIKPVKKQMKQNAPIDTGELKKALNHKSFAKDQFAVVYSGISQKKHQPSVVQKALAMEYGNNRQKAKKPFIQPAVDQSNFSNAKQEVIELIEKRLDELLND